MDCIVIGEDEEDFFHQQPARDHHHGPKVGDVFTLSSWISRDEHAASDAPWDIPLRTRLYCVIGINERRSSFIAIHEHVAPDGSRLRIHTRFRFARKTREWAPVIEERRARVCEAPWICWHH